MTRVIENIEKDYTVRNMYFLSDKTLDSFQINSKLVWDCYQSLVKLAKHNRIQLIWVPGHMGIDWNEIADQLSRQGSPLLLTGQALSLPWENLQRLPGAG
jgi:ribonuclease HI